jgi:hypothetical protein
MVNGNLVITSADDWSQLETSIRNIMFCCYAKKHIQSSNRSCHEDLPTGYTWSLFHHDLTVKCSIARMSHLLAGGAALMPASLLGLQLFQVQRSSREKKRAFCGALLPVVLIAFVLKVSGFLLPSD